MLCRVRCFTVSGDYLDNHAWTDKNSKELHNKHYIVSPGDIVYYGKFLLVRSNPVHGHIYQTKYNYELEVYEMCEEYTFCSSFTIYPGRYNVWVFTPFTKPYGSTINEFVYMHYNFNSTTMELQKKTDNGPPDSRNPNFDTKVITNPESDIINPKINASNFNYWTIVNVLLSACMV